LCMSCSLLMSYVFFFFFQAEDGIRDDLVTGVQTCALPISATGQGLKWGRAIGASPRGPFVFRATQLSAVNSFPPSPDARVAGPQDRKSTRLNSSHQIISYAVFCLQNTNIRQQHRN